MNGTDTGTNTKFMPNEELRRAFGTNKAVSKK